MKTRYKNPKNENIAMKVIQKENLIMAAIY
jgi:hypothetical protein